MNKNYYKWESVADFENWHTAVKSALGIPYANKNAATGEIDEDSTWTTAYTNLRTDLDGALFAEVEESVANNFVDGLGIIFIPNLPSPTTVS